MPIKTIILAAGQGTRMRSAKPKVLHKIAEKSLGIKLKDEERINGHRSWNYRRKPGLEFKSKTKNFDSYGL